MKSIITLFALSAASLCAAPAVQSNMMNNGTPGNVNPNTMPDSLYNNTSDSIRNNTMNRNSGSSTQDFRNSSTDYRNTQTPDSMRNMNQDTNTIRSTTPDSMRNSSTPYSRNGSVNPNSPSYTRNDSNNPARNPSYTAEIDAAMEKAQANTKYPQDTGTTFKDQEINKKIRNKIEGWFADDYKDVILKTDNGVVTLSGDVETEALSRDLADQVRKVDGVTSVINNVKARTLSNGVKNGAAPVVTPATVR